MSLLELAKKRKTIRIFSEEKISIEDVVYGINTAREAPSGANMQPWRFLVVTDRNVKRKVRGICEEIEKEYHKIAPRALREWYATRGINWQKPFLESAPILIFVFSDKTAPYHIQSTWIAVGYLLLALEEKKLASLTYTPSKVKWANSMFEVPSNYILQVIIPVGKTGDPQYKKQSRRSLKEILFLEKGK